MQFEWHKIQAAADSARQQAQFESQLDWQRAQVKVEKATQEEQFAWQRDMMLLCYKFGYRCR